MNLIDWVAQATGDASARSIADRMRKSHTAVARWIREGDMPCYAIIELASVYKADPVEGLMAGGFISPDDMRNIGMQQAVKFAPSEMLILELADRARTYKEASDRGEEWNPPHVAGPFGEGWLR